MGGTTPLARFDVRNENVIAPSTPSPARIGVRGTAGNNTVENLIAGAFSANNSATGTGYDLTGVYSLVTGNGATSYGIRSINTAVSTINYGVFGSAQGTLNDKYGGYFTANTPGGVNVGVYAQMIQNGTGNYVAEFNAGSADESVFIDSQGEIGIGGESNGHDIRIFRNQPGIFLQQNTAVTVANSSMGNGIVFGDAQSGSQTASIAAWRDLASSSGTDLPTALVFRTAADGTSTQLERMRLTSAGNLGIGTTLPNHTLHVETAVVGTVARFGSATGDAIQIGSNEEFSDAGSFIMAVNSEFVPSTDNIRSLGSTTLRWQDVWAVDGTINTSDAREKQNIRNLPYGLQQVMALRPVSYEWISNPERGTQLGFIAQEVLNVLPEAVVTHDYRVVDEETGRTERYELNRMGIKYAEFAPVLVAAVQEQQRQIEELRQQAQQRHLTTTGIGTVPTLQQFNTLLARVDTHDTELTTLRTQVQQQQQLIESLQQRVESMERLARRN
jgi:hypothetical protein